MSDTDYQHWWAVESTIKVSSTVDTDYTYMIKNYNSGLYMDIDGGTKTDGTNVQQWGADSSASYNTWTLVSAGNGYYYIISLLGDGQTWYLTVDDGSSTSGTNVAIYTNDGTSAQLFKFVENSNGTYTIYTKSSKDTCCLEVVDYSTASGANIVQATSDSGSNQYWILEKIDSIEVVASAETTTTTTTTTTATSATTTTETETETETETTTTSDIADTSDVTEDTTITTTVFTTTTTVTTTETTTTVSTDLDILIGDVNLDGTLSLADVVKLSKYVAGSVDLTVAALINSDVDDSNYVDADDALILLKFQVQLIDKLPYVES
ncbi:MAG: RICIN domain-containing protein [Ruminococcus sp.]|nr:RICIN domain-containing protein [Ruminococcus sp.]